MADHGLELRTAYDIVVQDYVTKAIADATGPLQAQLDAARTRAEELAVELDASQTEVADVRADLDAAEVDLLATRLQLQTVQSQLTLAIARIAELEEQLEEPEPPAPLRPTQMGASATAKSGITTSDLAEFNRLEQISGKALEARRTFETMPTSGTAQTWSMLKAAADVGKRRSIISWKCDLAAIARRDPGAKSRWWSLISSMPYDHPIDVTIHHEPDPEVDPALYKAAYAVWSEWVDEFKGLRTITKFWCLTGWGFYGPTDDPTRRAINWWPGDHYVDLVATDSYNLNTSKYYPLNDPLTGAKQAWDFAKAHGKRFGIAEWGCYDQTGNRRPDFISNGVAWARSLGRDGNGPVCEYLLWFHSNVNSATATGFWLDTTTPSLSAWKSAL